MDKPRQKRESPKSQTARLVEHYFSGHTFEKQIAIQDDHIELNLQQTRNTEILAWLDVIFADKE